MTELRRGQTYSIGKAICQAATLSGFECQESPTVIAIYTDHERWVCPRHASLAPKTSRFFVGLKPLPKP